MNDFENGDVVNVYHPRYDLDEAVVMEIMTPVQAKVCFSNRERAQVPMKHMEKIGQVSDVDAWIKSLDN